MQSSQLRPSSSSTPRCTSGSFDSIAGCGWPLSRQAHPRSRGEHAGRPSTKSRKLGSSPLTRGAPNSLTKRRGHPRLIPAHAGSTYILLSHGGIIGAHPRSRGEHIAAFVAATGGHGSSPLTRGALWAMDVDGNITGLIPAHAGSTYILLSHGGIIGAHPRSRGEHDA